MTKHTASTKTKPLTIAGAARHLGVSRAYLSRVVHGLKSSPEILRRYQALRRRHAGTSRAVLNLAAVLPEPSASEERKPSS